MKTVIPLHPESSRPGTHLGRPPLTRRAFLAGSAILTGTLAVGTPLSLLTPSRTWAAEMKVLDDTLSKQLLRLTQVIYPHENMPEAINALAVRDLDAAVTGDAELLASLQEGFAMLDAKAGGDWMKASAEEQLAAVEASTDTTLFATVRGRAVTSLYDNPLAYAHFGYEGEAFDKGGYLFRGFDDLAWLPDPPADASPPKQ